MYPLFAKKDEDLRLQSFLVISNPPNLDGLLISFHFFLIIFNAFNWKD